LKKDKKASFLKLAPNGGLWPFEDTTRLIGAIWGSDKFKNTIPNSLKAARASDNYNGSLMCSVGGIIKTTEFNFASDFNAISGTCHYTVVFELVKHLKEQNPEEVVDVDDSEEEVDDSEDDKGCRSGDY